MKKKKNFKGNISILVIFLMIATSLMGLLSMHFVNQMLEYSSVVHDYYKTHYLTKAGIELGLAEANVRGIGFSTQIGSGFFDENFSCGKRCEINAQVLGKTQIARDIFRNTGAACSPENAFHLATGENLILPLFSEEEFTTQKENLERLDSAKEQITEDHQNLVGSKYQGFTEQNIKKIEIKKLNQNGDLDINMGVLALKKIEGGKIGEYNSDIVYFQKKPLGSDSIETFFGKFSQLYKNDIANHFFYILIGNANEETLSFCVQTNESTFGNQKKLPAQRFWIESIGKYDDTILSMEAKYRQAIPDFFANIGGL